LLVSDGPLVMGRTIAVFRQGTVGL
jgi:hypothetical protein